MSTTTKTTRLLVVLSFGLLFSDAHDSVSRSHRFLGKQLVVGPDSFENTTLSYATCDIGKNQTEKKCTVVRETNVPEGTSKTISCEVTLKTDKAERTIGPNLRVVSLGLNGTILVWTMSDKKESQGNETIVRYTSIKFPECEKSNEAKLSFASKDDKGDAHSYLELVRIATYNDNTYSLAFSNDSLCGEKAICKLHVDPEANRVDDPKIWFTPESNVSDVVPVVAHSQENGHLIVEGMFVNVPQAYVVKTNGQMMKLPSEVDSQRSWKLVYSTTHSTIGLCYYSNSSFNCAQYDHEGRPTLRSNPDVGFVVQQAAMYNLREGRGFLLLTSRCESICAMNDDHYYITKFDAQGRKIGEAHLTGFHREALTNLVQAQFFEKEDEVYCVSMLRYDISSTNESPDMLLFAKCFDDKNFQ